MADVHLRFGGSTAGRLLHCAAWPVLADTLPLAESSDYANTGNALHDAIEQMLLDEGEPNAYDYVGFVAHDVELTLEHVQTKLEPAWLEWLKLCKEYGIVEYEPEVFVKLHDDTGGTIDVLGVTSDGRRVLVDFKFGDGVIVEAVGNSQLQFYDACAIRDPEMKDWLASTDASPVLVIIQPTDRDHTPTKTWEPTLEACKSFVNNYAAQRKRALAAKTDDLDLYGSGGGCRFCPCKAICPLKTGVVDKRKRLDPSHLSQLTDAMHIVEDVEQWCAAVRKMAHEQMERGDKIPGFKLVNKRPTRRWAQEAEVEEIVRRSKKVRHDETHESKLLSPAKMEKLYKGKGLDFARLSDYVATVSSGTTVARESDPRPEAVPVQAFKAMRARA